MCAEEMRNQCERRCPSVCTAKSSKVGTAVEWLTWLNLRTMFPCFFSGLGGRVRMFLSDSFQAVEQSPLSSIKSAPTIHIHSSCLKTKFRSQAFKTGWICLYVPLQHVVYAWTSSDIFCIIYLLLSTPGMCASAFWLMLVVLNALYKCSEFVWGTALHKETKMLLIEWTDWILLSRTCGILKAIRLPPAPWRTSASCSRGLY